MNKFNNFWYKFLTWAKTRQAILVGVIALSFIITGAVISLLSSIYVKDKPSIIPPEVRKDIRGVIKENVAEPIAGVVPKIGQPIVAAAYISPVATSDNNNESKISDSPGSASSDPTANWNIYKDQKLGFEIKYPDDYTVDSSGDVVGVVRAGSNDFGLWFYDGNSNSDVPAWWADEKKKYTANFSEEKLLINDIDVVKASTEEGMGEVHYILKINGKIVDVLSIGGVTNEEIINTIKAQKL